MPFKTDKQRKAVWALLGRQVIAHQAWIEKEKKKRVHETAPAFEAAPIDNWLPITVGKSPKRHTNATRATYKQTLRGVRK